MHIYIHIHIYEHIYMYIYASTYVYPKPQILKSNYECMRERAREKERERERCYRVAKTHRMPYLYRSSSAKEPYNQWLFCEK